MATSAAAFRFQWVKYLTSFACLTVESFSSLATGPEIAGHPQGPGMPPSSRIDSLREIDRKLLEEKLKKRNQKVLEALSDAFSVPGRSLLLGQV